MPDMTPGVPSALSPLVRRIVANNPGPMTGPGTNTYLVGIDEVAVIDPGPEDAGHIEAIIGASMRERVRWVLLTHTHPDHWPAARYLADQTGAEILMFPVKGVDLEPDGWLENGQVIEGTEFGLEVIHTPGHASNHVCFFLEEERAYVTGDHIMNGSTVVIPPPDGNMAHYLDSLELLKKRTRLTRIYPGHGEVIDDAKGKIQEYIEHRLMREAQIVGVLEDGPSKIPAIVARLYEGLHEEIVPAPSRPCWPTSSSSRAKAASPAATNAAPGRSPEPGWTGRSSSTSNRHRGRNASWSATALLSVCPTSRCPHSPPRRSARCSSRPDADRDVLAARGALGEGHDAVGGPGILSRDEPGSGLDLDLRGPGGRSAQLGECGVDHLLAHREIVAPAVDVDAGRSVAGEHHERLDLETCSVQSVEHSVAEPPVG